MSQRALALLATLAVFVSMADAHPRRRIRTRAEAHLSRGLRLMHCGQTNEARHELELARRFGDAIVEQEATWALQDLGVDHRSISIYVEDRVREAEEADERGER